MARFMATAQCGRGRTHRIGPKAAAEAKGWDIGGRVTASKVINVAGIETDVDDIAMYITSGSNEKFPPIRIAEFNSEGELTIYAPDSGDAVWNGKFRE